MRSSLSRSSILTFIAAGVIVWGTASTSARQAAPLPVTEFWFRIRATLATVESLGGQDAATARAGLDKEAAAWEAVTTVQLDDGTLVPLDTSSLVSQLRADPPDLVALRVRLQTLLDARDGWQPPSGAPGGAVSADPTLALKQILAGSDFQWEQQTAGPNLIQAFIDKLLQQFWQWISGLLPDEMTADISWMRWLVILMASLVLAAILLYAVRRIAGGLVAEDALDIQADDGSEVVTSESALRHAQDTSRAGDYRSAVRWLYLSSLLTLDERGLLHYDRTRTNREYLRSVGNAPELAHSLRDIVDVFDRVWYGFQPIDAPTFKEYVNRVTELRRIR